MMDDDKIYTVVINKEEQYSIWPEDRELPHGWSAVVGGKTKEEAMAYIDEVWTDMRPKSLREKMAEAGES